jgi:hypothetical protein
VQRPVSFDPGCITTEFIRLISAELSEPICWSRRRNRFHFLCIHTLPQRGGHSGNYPV